MVLDPYQYDDMETYMELAYLKRKYKLDYLKIYDTYTVIEKLIITITTINIFYIANF